MLLKRDTHRFTVDDYHEMIEHGILTENDRVELLRGEIIQKMSIGSRHARSVKRTNRLLSRILADRAIVGVQDPVQLADSEPEPDISLLRLTEDFYGSDNPCPSDVLLLIEIADSTLDFDRDFKGKLYAENGIAEYWIVNLKDECLEIYRQPNSDGTYSQTQVLHRGQEIEIAAFPGVKVAVDQLL